MSPERAPIRPSTGTPGDSASALATSGPGSSSGAPDGVDAIVVGAGVIGAAVAFELAKRGYATLNIDRLPAAGYGSTSSSCADVRAHYSTLQGVAIAYEGFAYWRNWEQYLGVSDDAGSARYVEAGTVLLKSASGRHEAVLEHYRALGVEFEEWSAAELERRLPFYDLGAFWPPTRPTDARFWRPPEEKVAGAIFTPGSGYVNDPQLATHNLQRAAEAYGARFLFKEEIVEIRHNRERVQGVTLSDGRQIASPIVINAAGPYSFLINRMAGVESSQNIHTRPLRQEVHLVPAPPGLDFEADGLPTSDPDNGIDFRPDVGNQILVASLDPDCDPRVWVEDPDVFQRHVTESQWEAQVYRLARRMPTLGIPSERKGVVDLYDVSDDWIPIYDRSDLPGFYMAIGTSGNQFKNAPVVGRLMAELIDQVESGHDHDRDPIKLPALHSGSELDLGFYSRLREPTRESSLSVNG